MRESRARFTEWISNNRLVARVSSQSNMSANRKISNARKVMSLAFPMGVAVM